MGVVGTTSSAANDTEDPPRVDLLAIDDGTFESFYEAEYRPLMRLAVRQSAMVVIGRGSLVVAYTSGSLENGPVRDTQGQAVKAEHKDDEDAKASPPDLPVHVHAVGLAIGVVLARYVWRSTR